MADVIDLHEPPTDADLLEAWDEVSSLAVELMLKCASGLPVNGKRARIDLLEAFELSKKLLAATSDVADAGE